MSYDAQEKKFFLSPEQVAVFVDEDSPVNMAGGFRRWLRCFADELKLEQAFQVRLRHRLGRSLQLLVLRHRAVSFRPGYKAHLVSEWLPALGASLISKLESGARWPTWVAGMALPPSSWRRLSRSRALLAWTFMGRQ